MKRRTGLSGFCGVVFFLAGVFPLADGVELVASDSKEPSLPQARVLVRSGDYEAAAQMLEVLAVRQPNHGPTWTLLGYVRHRRGQLKEALPAYLTAIRVSQSAPLALYNAACVYARLGEPQKSLNFLRRAEQTGQIDLRQAETDPDLASIRDRAQFRDLRPTPEQYADPFVGKVAILQEWVGEAPLGQFGWIARNLGDVDGDGCDDVVTSAPSLAKPGPSSGCVYVYSSKTGELLWRKRGNPGDFLGQSVEAAGDTNGDGVPDVIAGAPGVGAAFVYSGDDGEVLLTLKGSVGESFAGNVTGGGDFDGDGCDEVLVAAPFHPGKGSNVGRVFVYSGKKGGLLFSLSGEANGHRFGSSIASKGDGKHSFIAVGAPGAGPRNTGRLYVYSGTGEQKFLIENDETGVQLGAMFSSIVGDVNGDGVLDIYASDSSHRAKGPSTGRVFVHSGKNGERLLTLTGEGPGDGFGIGVADAGDTDGDGCHDLIVGAWLHKGAARSGGKCTLYSGKSGKTLREITSKVPGETFGFDTTGLGDVNGDGLVDFLLTSAWSGVEGSRSGRVFVVAGE